MSRPGARIGVISNPASGHNRDHFPAASAALADCPGLVEHIVTDCIGDIPPALETLAAAEVDTLVVNGGDGTVAAVLGAMLESGVFGSQPGIAILPAGTVNMTAGDVGVRGRHLAAASRLCRWAAGSAMSAGDRIERRLLKLEVDGHVHHGMFLGSGAIISGTDYAHRRVHARGVRGDASLALTTMRTVWGVLRDDTAFNATTRIRVALDDEPAREHDALILAISTLHRLSFGMRPFWGKGDGPLRLTLVDRGCRHFLPNFISIIRGRPGRGARPERGYHSANGHVMSLDISGPVNLDGEVFTPVGTVRLTPTAPVSFLRL